MSTKPQRKAGLTSPKSAPSYNPSSKWHGFVNVYLDEKTKQAAADWFSVGDNLYNAVSAALGEGYRITLKMDVNDGSYSAFMTPIRDDHENAGWGLSERAGDWYKALRRIMYIHHVVLGGDWSSNKQYSFVDQDW